IEQSQLMAQALTRAGKDVKLVVYDGEGHSDWSRADEESALTEIASFVQSHIAPASTGGWPPAVRRASVGHGSRPGGGGHHRGGGPASDALQRTGDEPPHLVPARGHPHGRGHD